MPEKRENEKYPNLAKDRDGHRKWTNKPRKNKLTKNNAKIDLNTRTPT